MMSRARVAVVVAALVVGAVAPVVAAVVGEGTLVTLCLSLVTTRSWWAIAVVCAVAVAVCAARFSRFFCFVPLAAVLWATWTGVMVRDDKVSGLRVASWNLAKGELGSPAQLLDGLRSFDADVVCLSEAGSYDWLPLDVEALAGALTMSTAGTGETRALSRLPVLAVEERALWPGPARRPLLIVDVEKGGRRYRVGCLHLMPKLLLLDDSVDRGLARNGPWSLIAQTARAQGLTLRDALIDEGGANGSGAVDVVIGDWNNQPWGRVVGDVKAVGYDDVFGGSGAVTIGHGLLGKRIDLALVHHDLWVRDASILDVVGSDHEALVVELGPWRGR